MAQSTRKRIFKALQVGDLVLFADCVAHRTRESQEPVSERVGLVTKVHKTHYNQITQSCSLLCENAKHTEILYLTNFIRLLSPSIKE